MVREVRKMPAIGARLLLVCILGVSLRVGSADECTLMNGGILSGVDVVAYRQSKPGSTSAQGRAIHSKTYGNFSFYFVDNDNAALFDANPSYYAPQW